VCVVLQDMVKLTSRLATPLSSLQRTARAIAGMCVGG
jgi:hypothetical protein